MPGRTIDENPLDVLIGEKGKEAREAGIGSRLPSQMKPSNGLETRSFGLGGRH